MNLLTKALTLQSKISFRISSSNGGFSDLELWQENLEDLTDQPWVKDLVKETDAPMTKDGKLYGKPIGVEGYGYIYNKDLLPNNWVIKQKLRSQS